MIFLPAACYQPLAAWSKDGPRPSCYWGDLLFLICLLDLSNIKNQFKASSNQFQNQFHNYLIQNQFQNQVQNQFNKTPSSFKTSLTKHHIPVSKPV